MTGAPPLSPVDASDAPATRMQLATDRTSAGEALRLMRDHVHLLYRGDERNARQLFAALRRRLAQPPRARPGVPARELFHRERAARLDEHRVMERLLVELDSSYRLVLDHASDVAAACEAAWGPSDGKPRLIPLRELLGVIGAHEWQRRGIAIPCLGRIHPWYGVFAPTRPSYVELFAEAPAPTGLRVLDIGTGTGVLALVAARRGAREVVAIDVDPRAVACARENADRLGLASSVHIREGDLFADEEADLYVFNPPWLPGKPRTPFERTVFDPDGRLLQRFLAGLGERLTERSQGWLLLSDLAERLGLRASGEVEEDARRHGLAVSWVRSRPSSQRPETEAADPLSIARREEQVLLRCFVRA